MKSNHIRLAVLLGSISIIGIIVFQLYWINRSFDLAENQFNQTVSIALYNVAEKMSEFNGSEMPNENPVRQISSNYFIVDINDEIDASILDHYLKTEFEYSNIHIDYEYAIYDCETNRMVYGTYVRASDNNRSSHEKFQKYDEFTYYFGILFPSKSIYILKSLNLWIISAFVLLTAIIFFAYAMFIILRQKRLSEIQKDFINNMTHEFKTPLSTISISSGVLSDPEIINDPERLRNYASIIGSQTKRLENHIQKVLQLAKFERGRPGLAREMIDLHELVTETMRNFRLNVRDRKIDLKTELNAARHIVEADSTHLSNLVYNLIDNAVKYSEGMPEVTVATENRNGMLYLSVTDKGRGIEKRYHRKIFSKFFRVPTGNVHDVKGFGLGLNYVSTIVDAHGWKLELESESGKGSRFVLIIPVKQT